MIFLRVVVYTICCVIGVFFFNDRYGKIGMASWYGITERGKITASGVVYKPEFFTAAHRTLPLGTIVRVRNLRNGRTVVVEVTDRGPWAWGRIIDISQAAASSLDMIDDGVSMVEIEVCGRLPIVKKGESLPAFYPIFSFFLI